MQRFNKSLFLVLLLLSGGQTAFGYSYGGPINNGGDNWQSPVIGYGLAGDLNAPKNIGEEYRRNTPVMYYTFDQNFFDYFGAEGANSVSSAFTALNTLTNVDRYSKQLVEFPVESRNVNYQAQALGLFDLKSWTMGLMMEQLGLADPVRYSWTLHDRFLPPGGRCPDNMEYLVVQRNFDFAASSLTSLQYSPYVNNVLFTYQIFEFCTGPNPLAVASPYSVDPLADSSYPLATFSLAWGNYYTGLTRDDMAGLRSLLSTNNINWETPAPDAVLISTNTSVLQLFPTSVATNGVLVNGTYYGTASYSALTSFAQTNGPAALAGQYPGLQFTLVSNYFAAVTVTNVVAYFTNYIGSPAGTPATLVVKTNLTLGIQEFFFYTFDNIVTNIYRSTTATKVQKITVGSAVGSPAGSPAVTNISSKNVTLNIPYGEFYILPTNSPCGLHIASTVLTFTNYTTNILFSTLGGTNSTGTSGTNTTSGTQSYAQIQIVPFVGHVFAINPVTCDQAPVTGLYRGVSRLSYVRADYDSLLGQFWQPITNDYAMTIITNSRAATLKLRRVVTEPDFLFSAVDLTTGPAAVPVNFVFSRNLNFDTANVLPGLAGPGTITSSTTVEFNKNGPVYFNTPLDTMDGTSYFTKTPGNDVTDLFYFAPYFVWASYDGSTNDPVVFPNGTSIENLQNQVLVQISVKDSGQNLLSELPLGIAGSPYDPVTFSASGGAFTAPFTWSNPDLVLSGLGLSFSPDGVLSGTPTQSGTFDFAVKLTDTNGRSVSWNYSILIQ